MVATIIRTAILYLIVTVAIRLMGKRQIGDMQPNELVITLLISEIAAIPLQDTNQPIINGVAAISILVVFEILVSTLALKSGIIRHLINGKAVILIRDGKIDQKAMKSVRVTVDDLLEMMRSKDVFDINEIAFAILEVNGELNVLLKSEYNTVTLGDLNIASKTSSPYLPIVIDGCGVKENMKLYNLKKKDIKLLSDKKDLNQKDVFLMLYEENGNYEIIKKEK